MSFEQYNYRANLITNNISRTHKTAREMAASLGWRNSVPDKTFINASGSFVISREKSENLQTTEKLVNNGIIEERGSKIVLRGPAFYLPLQLALPSGELINQYLQLLNISSQREIKNEFQSLVLSDFIRHVSLTLLNATFSQQKKGYKLTTELQTLHKKLIEFSKKAIDDYYTNLLLPNKLNEDNNNLKELVQLMVENHSELSSLPRENYKITECSNPVRIIATSLAIASDNPSIDWIIGIPSGSTEASIVLKQVYFKALGENPSLIFFPSASFHTEGINQERLEDKKKNFLENFSPGSKGIIIDDNSSTGKTLDFVLACLSEGNIKNANAYVVEADIARIASNKNRNEKTTIPNERFFEHISGILPVTGKNHPTRRYKAEVNKINVYGREALIRSFFKSNKNNDPVLDLYNRIRANLVTYPSYTLKRLIALPEDTIWSLKDTYLSNSYPVKISYGGLEFPSVEHAYQYARLGHIDQNIFSTIVGDLLLTFGLSFNSKDLTTENIFTSQALSSSLIEKIRITLEKKTDFLDWTFDKKIKIMSDLLWKKFQNQELAEELLNTKNFFILAGNTLEDDFWGVQIPVNFKEKYLRGELSGEGGLNLLGRMLMEIREKLR